MSYLHIDIETYSPVDIKTAGAYAYAGHPEFEILLIGYRFDSMEMAEVIDLSELSKEEAIEHIQDLYPDVYEALTDESIIKCAFNANFERTCLARYFGEMDPKQWHCTMIRAAAMGLPMSLEAVGEVLHLGEDKAKLKTGKALISYFCKPCRPTRTNGGRTRNLAMHDPEKWRLFKEYCARDVDSEYEIAEILGRDCIPESEQTLWELDQKMNDTGVQIDHDYVKGILLYNDKRNAELMEEAMTITGLKNPNSIAQLRGWLSEQGVQVDSLTKAVVADILSGNCSDDVRRVLEIRQALGKTSTSKYKAMMEAACEDSRLRGILQFYGASRTGRWAGRIVQVHNLPQNHIDDIEWVREKIADFDFEAVEMVWGELAPIFSQLVRTAFIPSDGNTFIVADFSAIEARVLAWLAGEDWRTDVFKRGGDIYCASATQMFGVPVEKHGQNAHLRQKGKIAELALGYQGGVGAMKAMDSSGAIPEKELPGIVEKWRAASPNIVNLWWTMEKAAKAAVRDCRPEKRACRVKRGVEFFYDGDSLRMRLPSGRCLTYRDPYIMRQEDGREHLMYAGINQTTKQWTELETYGGKLVENCIQGIARDCLAETIKRVMGKGYSIVMHVHDEIIVDAPKDGADDSFREIIELMSIPPDWAPDLILRGDGYTTDFYKKD